MTEADARMALLRQRFKARASADRAAIAEALGAGDRDQLLHLAHGLAGIAGIFGHAEVGACASSVEAAIDAAEPEAELAALTQALIAALDAVGGGA